MCPWRAVQEKRPVQREAERALVKNNPGSDLLSHTVTHAVPSAVTGLTSVFGMGTGVTLLLLPPGNRPGAAIPGAWEADALGASGFDINRGAGTSARRHGVPASPEGAASHAAVETTEYSANGSFNLGHKCPRCVSVGFHRD